MDYELQSDTLSVLSFTGNIMCPPIKYNSFNLPLPVIVKKKSGNPMAPSAFEDDIADDTSGFFKRLLISASTVSHVMFVAK